VDRPVTLITEEDATLRGRLIRLLHAEGFHVVDLTTQKDALRQGAIPGPDLVIVGAGRDDAWARLEDAQHVRRWAKHVPIIFLTPESSERLAIAALRAGVNDYFSHPIPFVELTASIRRNRVATGWPPRNGDATAPGVRMDSVMIGNSPEIREINAYIERLALVESTVLITGETGTGKELAAELIHRGSRRQRRPFVRLNCAAIPDSLLESELFGYERGAFTGAHIATAGKLQLADGGTVLLDEVGDMSPYAQAKILRLIENKEIERLGGRRNVRIDVRILAATNQDLERMVADGRFRKDLYFRLNVARINVPPLRDRKEDLPALLAYYVGRFNRDFGRDVEGISRDALDILLSYEWPGNVRELKNLVESGFANVRSGRISLADLPPSFCHLTGNGPKGPESTERDRLLATLVATKWNKSKAAERLHWSRMTVYRKMAKYRLAGAETATADPMMEHVAGPPQHQCDAASPTSA